jgi:hypothetical protein
MSAAASQYANQYVNQSVNQAAMQAGYPNGQAYAPTQQFPPQQRIASFSPPAQRQQGYRQAGQQAYSNYANANRIATAGSFYSMPQQAMQPQAVYPAQTYPLTAAPSPLMAAPHGMGEAQQQFGTAGQMPPYPDASGTRLKTLINR